MVKSKKGFTYIEIIMSLFILLLIVGITFKANAFLYHMKYKSNLKNEAFIIAENILEEYKSNPNMKIKENDYKFDIILTTTPISNTLEEIIITIFLDIEHKEKVILSHNIIGSDILFKER